MSDVLLQRHPGLAAARLRLGDWPTPIDRVEALDRGQSALWVKREDLASALYGGNKVRKLEWILPQAKARGGLLSLGAAGSNYLLACALHGALHGVPVEAVVMPQRSTPHVRENAALLAQRARVWPAGSELGVAWTALKAMRAVKRERGQSPLPVWIGGSSPRGTLGWVGAAFELAEQVSAGVMEAPTDVVVAMGSGGTAAGLVLGLPAAGLAAKVHAIRVADKPFANRSVALWLARRARRLLLHDDVVLPEVEPERLLVHHDWFGAGYGQPSAEGTAAIAAARQATGLELEPTYTGKAMAGCLALMQSGALGPRVLFVHTLSATRPSVTAALPPELEPLMLEGP